MANVNLLATTVARSPALARATAPVAQNAARLVGISKLDPVTVKTAAISVASLPAKQKNEIAKALNTRKIVLGTTAVTGAALLGYSADQLTDLFNSADPAQLLDFLDVVDSVDKNVGDAVEGVYNARIRLSQLDTDFSDERSNDIFLAQAPVSGLGLDRQRIENEQTLVREYDMVRRSLSMQQILSLQFLIHHASAEDIATLEDMRENGRGR